MRNTLTTLGLVAAVVALSACGEKPQEMGGTRSDAAPYAGVGKSQYQQPGWKVGDKASWEQQLKSRAQYGMNEYTRATQ
jgi:predicted small lipoprotein YifL